MSLIDELNALLPDSDLPTLEDTWEFLRQRITVLSERAWEGKNQWPEVEAWLNNFNGLTGLDVEVERLHALFLLSQFLYIGSVEIRVLLQALYRDLFLIPLIQEVRGSLANTRDLNRITPVLTQALEKTRFLGVGNPSESGVHLLYYFRQENQLPKDRFLDSAAMFATELKANGTTRRVLAHPEVERYVFVDDVCGSGETAYSYSKNMLAELVALKPDVKLFYFSMFATAAGMELVRTGTRFGSNSGAVFELDESYRCLSDRSRISFATPAHINREHLREVAMTYGSRLWSEHPGGFDDNQLLLGFHHNTPDNTLPVIWVEGSHAVPWTPAFKRYPKIL